MNRIEELKNYFINLDEVKRLKELEPYIKNNKEINDKFTLLLEKQKQIVNAREFKQINQLKIYEEEYKKIKEDLYNLPFVEEYLELVELINNKLEELKFFLEKKLDEAIN